MHLGRIHKLTQFLTDGQKRQIADFKSDLTVKISQEERKLINEKVYDTIITDSACFNLFEKPGMRALIKVLKSGYTPPSRKTIGKNIKKR